MKASEKSIAVNLHGQLLEFIELRSQIKLAHWNLKDPAFIALHEHFDKLAKIVDLAADEVAERIRQLGQVVDTDTSVVAKDSQLKAFPKGLVSGSEACKALVKALNTLVDSIEESIDVADESGDAVSADILTKIAGDFDKQRWLLESHF